jgi:hypothetical protein
MLINSVIGNSNGQLDQADSPERQEEQERLQNALARRMADEAREEGTQRLIGHPLDSTKPAPLFSAGPRSESAYAYTVLPVSLAEKVDLNSVTRWRVELHGLDGSAGPMGFDLIGDVVIGRGKDGPDAPDVNLDPFAAQKMGVSRRHVILRPTERHLYLIDLNSTNGTVNNGVPVGPGVARSLQHNDTIMLGNLSFTLKIIASPNNDSIRPNPETMTVVELLGRENARKILENPKSSADSTQRLFQDRAAPPPPNLSTASSADRDADIPPRSIPSSQRKAAPGKPAKIMELRARKHRLSAG